LKKLSQKRDGEEAQGVGPEFKLQYSGGAGGGGDTQLSKNKNNQSKTDWSCDSNSRVPALQVQSLEFKPQFHTPKKTCYKEENSSINDLSSYFKNLVKVK
jgi:hypothetical protein